MTYWAIAASIFGFLYVPYSIISRSRKKLSRSSWEWVIIGFFAISIYIALAQSWWFPHMRGLIGFLPFGNDINTFLYDIFIIAAIFIGPV